MVWDLDERYCYFTLQFCPEPGHKKKEKKKKSNEHLQDQRVYGFYKNVVWQVQMTVFWAK